MTPPEDLRERVEKEFMITMWDDLEIWRYQKYVEHPAWRGRTPSRTRRCGNGPGSSTRFRPEVEGAIEGKASHA